MSPAEIDFPIVGFECKLPNRASRGIAVFVLGDSSPPEWDENQAACKSTRVSKVV